MINLPPKLEFITPKVACITLQRPSKANALESDDLLLLEDYFENLGDACVLIFKAEGKQFSSGFDLTTAKAGGENRFSNMTNKLAALSVLTIASIQGAVVGGSTDLALACDIVIGSERAKMMMPAAKIGITLYDGALQRYTARLGISVAKRLIFMGEFIDADEMKRINFLSELVSHENLENRTLEIAQKLSELPRDSAINMKRKLAEFTQQS